VANEETHRFFAQQGIEQIQPAYELQTPKANAPIMFCKYCLRHELGLCPKQTKAGAIPYKEPLRLRGTDGRTFRLKFDCAKCEMLVLPE
jgi:putative protease